MPGAQSNGGSRAKCFSTKEATDWEHYLLFSVFCLTEKFISSSYFKQMLINQSCHWGFPFKGQKHNHLF